MRLFLGGIFAFYLPGHPQHVELRVDQPTLLTNILAELGVPAAEVHLVSVNGELVELSKALVSQSDEVKIYPPVSGGNYAMAPGDFYPS